MSRSALYSGSARDASGQADFVHGRAPKIASLGSWDMYPFARKGRVIGLQCMTLLILKQLHGVSYKVLGMGHGSSYSSCCFCFCCLCSFRSCVKVSLWVVASCRNMAPATVYGSAVVDSYGRYIIMSLWSLAFRIGEIRRPSKAWSSNESKEVGWEVILNDPVGTASRSGFIGWVV